MYDKSTDRVGKKRLGPQPYLRPGTYMTGMMTESGKQLWPWTWARCVRFDDRVGKETAALNQVLVQVWQIWWPCSKLTCGPEPDLRTDMSDLMTKLGMKLLPRTWSKVKYDIWWQSLKLICSLEPGQGTWMTDLMHDKVWNVARRYSRYHSF